MASAVKLVGEAAPISLYLALADERRADLEVISRAAIAWAEAIRDAAFLTDPFLEVRVELVSGTESSINLNSVIRAVQDVVGDPKKLRVIALGIATYFATQFGGWVVGKGFDALWETAKHELGPAVVEMLSEDEKRDVEQTVVRIATAKSTAEKARRVYFELSKDDAVTGVGVSLVPGVRPQHVVPRSEFAERAGMLMVDEELVPRRTETDRLTLTLAAPALQEGDYKWKFQLGGKAVWAHMHDPDFQARLSPGSNSAPRMVTGIRMDVDLETVQELKEGVWTTVNQTVKRVYQLSEPVTQPRWLESPVQGDEPNGNN
jgi:hypothetical protein